MNTVRQSRRLGIIESAVGLLALLVSALTQLLPDALLHKPVYQVTEAAGRTVSYTWNQGLSTAAVSLGLLAIVFAVFAVIFREEKLLAGIAATLGAAAMAVQVWWILIVVAVAIVILSSLLS